MVSSLMLQTVSANLGSESSAANFRPAQSKDSSRAETNSSDGSDSSAGSNDGLSLLESGAESSNRSDSVESVGTALRRTWLRPVVGIFDDDPDEVARAAMPAMARARMNLTSLPHWLVSMELIYFSWKSTFPYNLLWGLGMALPSMFSTADKRRQLAISWEGLLIVLFYWFYGRGKYYAVSWRGDREDLRELAFSNALELINVQKHTLSLFEHGVQDATLPHAWVVSFFNFYYVMFHFLGTMGVFFYVLVKDYKLFVRWRTNFFIMLFIAICLFVLYPVMPPRLLGVCDDGEGEDEIGWGGCSDLPEHQFVDTLGDSSMGYNSEEAKKKVNQYGAFPSMHTGFSVWSALLACAYMKKKGVGWLRYFVFMHPALTVSAILITGNHYWIDAVAGASLVGLAYAIAYIVNRRFSDYLERSSENKSVMGLGDTFEKRKARFEGLVTKLKVIVFFLFVFVVWNKFSK